ncbi:MAG: IPT/TIG domain-containing protein [Planctomycetes bacterium]|nr:IPT/TIG domain-containing protein [Planctomycetota bacterium]
MLFTRAAALLALAALLPPVLAQGVPQAPSPRALPAPPALLARFDVMVGTVQDLVVPSNLPATVAVDVVLAGSVERLVLRQHEVRAPGFQLVERSAMGETVLVPPPCVTYRGEVLGDAGSEVAASLRDGSLTAWIRRGSGDLWLIQAVREVQPTAGAAAHVVYRGSDSSNRNGRCGVTGNVTGTLPAPPGTDAVYGCQLAIEADFPYYQLNGSSVTATQNDITSVVNAMDVIYRRDTQIALQLGTVIVNSTADPYSSSVAGTLLNQFGSYWNSNRGSVARDVAHLFTGRQMGAASSGTIGIAFLGVVCNLGSAYGVSQSRWSTNWNFRVGVTAHELGHNFNAGHCDAANPCNIMCSGVGGCNNNQTSFGATEQAQIVGFRQGLGCLSLIPTTPVITQVSPNTVRTFQPGLVTLNGTGFVGTNRVTVGGVNVTSGITVVSDTQLRFTPPAGLPIAFHALTATNASGTSNTAALWYTASNPCAISVPTVVLGGNTLTWQFGGSPLSGAFLVISLQGTTHPYQGFNILDGFTTLWFGGLDSRGMGTFAVPVPAGVLNGVRAYSQLIELDQTGAALRSVSNIISTLVLL